MKRVIDKLKKQYYDIKDDYNFEMEVNQSEFYDNEYYNNLLAEYDKVIKILETVREHDRHPAWFYSQKVHD